MSRTYAVIGGGIAGASIAYHLSERTDEEIMLLEKGSLASETTAKSIAQFGLYGDETQYRMKRYGKRLYNEFFREPNVTHKFTTAGHLTVTSTAEKADQFKSAIDTDGNEQLGTYGMGFDRDLVEYLSGKSIKEKVLAPLLDTERVEGALFRPNVGYVIRPREMVMEFVERTKNNGVDVRTETAVSDIKLDSGSVSAIETDGGGRIRVDEVVSAAGPWNPEIAEAAGISLPVRHTLAPVLKFSPQGDSEYAMPGISDVESPFSFYCRDSDELLAVYYPGGYEEGTKYEPDEINEAVPTDIRRDAIERVHELFPELQDSEVADEWTGIRSVTPDGNPIVGWTEVDGFSIAAFHTSGIQLAPAIGDIIASQLVDGDPTEFYDALSISRFEGYSDGK